MINFYYIIHKTGAFHYLHIDMNKVLTSDSSNGSIILFQKQSPQNQEAKKIGNTRQKIVSLYNLTKVATTL